VLWNRRRRGGSLSKTRTENEGGRRTFTSGPKHPEARSPTGSQQCRQEVFRRHKALRPNRSGLRQELETRRYVGGESNVRLPMFVGADLNTLTVQVIEKSRAGQPTERRQKTDSGCRRCLCRGRQYVDERRHPRGCSRTARGRCGSQYLHRGGLAPRHCGSTRSTPPITTRSPALRPLVTMVRSPCW
jgi:hypothetical protein